MVGEAGVVLVVVAGLAAGVRVAAGAALLAVLAPGGVGAVVAGHDRLAALALLVRVLPGAGVAQAPGGVGEGGVGGHVDRAAVGAVGGVVVRVGRAAVGAQVLLHAVVVVVVVAVPVRQAGGGGGRAQVTAGTVTDKRAAKNWKL